jgi:signal transduction histidine kinase
VAIRIDAIMERLDQAISWFIPEDIKADPELFQRARMFMISHALGPIIALPLPAFMYFTGFPADYRLIVFSCAILAFWSFPFMLRQFGHYRALAFVSVQNLIFTIMWACYCYGGVHSPFIPWLVTVPLLAFFYYNWPVKLRFALIGLVALYLGVFYGLYKSGHTFPPVRLEDLQVIGLISTVAAAVYVAMMAFYYARVLASQADLEAEISEHLATSNELRRAADEAVRAGAAKSEFVAKMSHELRTPLNAVIGYSQILLEDARLDGDTGSVTDLEHIQKAGTTLLRLVNDVLDLSKADAGKMEVYPEMVDLELAIRNTLDQRRLEVESQNNRLSLVVGDQLGTGLIDWRLVDRVLGQLLDNAGRFTRDGKVQVLISRAPAHGIDYLIMEVNDNGRGIEASRLPSLFKVFDGTDDVSESKYGGTGLGLPLSHKLCALLGGVIRVNSALGVGTSFRVELPLQPAATSQARQEQTEPPQPVSAAKAA